MGNKLDPKVDKLIKESKQWKEEISALRKIVLSTKLDEELKWRLPCYTYNGRNIAIIQPFKAFMGLMFFKGALLKDPKKALSEIGPNSQSARRFNFQSVSEIKDNEAAIKRFIKEAIAAEESGRKVEQKPLTMPVELKKALSGNAKLKKAFEALTPGRRRGYILHISGAKQTATRETRIKKCVPQILKGKGFNEF